MGRKTHQELGEYGKREPEPNSRFDRAPPER